MILSRILGFRLVTQNAGRLSAFYEALGLEAGEPRPITPDEMALLELRGRGTRTPLRLGGQWIDLDQFSVAGRPYPTDTSSADPIFQHFAMVTDDADAMWTRARDAGATPISRDGPVTLPLRSGGVRAVKFRDPDGHPLEFLQFPDPSDHPWRGKGVQGIDHSAIAVTDEARSRRFYEERGLSAVEGTLNHGAEQESLDDLDTVRVRVQPMKPAAGPTKLELLGYEQPRPRSIAKVPAVNDVAATRVVWAADREELVRDPDGHAHQLTA